MTCDWMSLTFPEVTILIGHDVEKSIAPAYTFYLLFDISKF